MQRKTQSIIIFAASSSLLQDGLYFWWHHFDKLLLIVIWEKIETFSKPSPCNINNILNLFCRSEWIFTVHYVLLTIKIQYFMYHVFLSPYSECHNIKSLGSVKNSCSKWTLQDDQEAKFTMSTVLTNTQCNSSKEECTKSTI